MKKLICCTLFSFVALSLFAQRRYVRHSYNAGTHTEFGLKGGINIANLNDREVSPTDSRTGLYLGGLAHIHLSHELALQPEVVYSAQGAEYSDGTAKFDYINIPVVVQYMFDGGFRLETGPQLGFLASAKYKNNNGVETDAKNSIKSTDFSWAFGASYITTSGLGFGARYNLGISNINAGSPYEVTNKVWQLGLFYQFHQ